MKKDGNKNRRPKKPFDPQNVTCYKCKEKGHLARTCSSRKKNGGERDKSKSRDHAFVVSSEESQGRSKVRDKSDEQFREVIDKVLAADNGEACLTDSGASRHISYRREWFDDFTPSNGGTVVLGNNGQCEVKGEGVIRVAKFVDGRWRESRIEGVLYTGVHKCLQAHLEILSLIYIQATSLRPI